MRKNVKILAMYLPQYHEIPENSEFWGKGFTDWVSVKKAEPLFKGHVEPKVPLGGNYYDLSQKESIAWQIGLAKQYGVYGFGIYHYWFSTEKVLLTKPSELLLENKDLDIPFFFDWDNANWRRTWSKVKGNAWSPMMDEQQLHSNESAVLIEYKLGSKPEWKKHFDYLLPYFIDKRYIKVNGKPLFVVCNYSAGLRKMSEYWNILAVEKGFNGVEIVYKYNPLRVPLIYKSFSYEPLYSGWGGSIYRIVARVCSLVCKEKLRKYSYDKVWHRLLLNAQINRTAKHWHGAFVNYDDTPRRGNRGKLIINGTPEKFEKYMIKLINICRKQDKEYIFLTAWNEWGEGAYMEPDQQYQYAYLDALKKALIETNNL